MRLYAFAIYFASTFAVGQTVSVGTASTVQSGSTTTITVPVTVTGSTTAGTVSAALPMLDVETNAANGLQPLATTFTTLSLGNVVIDTAKGWNTAANTYTAPNTGTYLIVSRVRLVDNTAAGLSYGQGVNTTNVDGTFFQWATTVGQRNESINVRLVKLTAGQAVSLYAYVDGSGSVFSASLSIQELN